MEERLNTLIRLRAYGDFGLRARDVRIRMNAELARVADAAKDWDGIQRILRSLGFHRKMILDYRVDPRTLRDRLAALRPDVLTDLPSVLAQVASAGIPTSIATSDVSEERGKGPIPTNSVSGRQHP